MKPILAWTLLLLISFQWIGVHVCFKITTLIESTNIMNNTEQCIASSLELETGIKTEIQIIDVSEINTEKIGYSGTFIFSKTIDNQPVHYTIQTNTPTQQQEIIINNPQNSTSDIPIILLNKSFQQLFHQNEITVFPTILAEIQHNHFSTQKLHTLFQKEVLPPIPLFV